MENMIQKIRHGFTAVLLAGLICPPVYSYAEAAAATAESDITYEHVASSEDHAKTVTVGKYGMLPIYGRDVRDGTYPIEVESSSSMFRIIHAELTVKDGTMEAILTLSGTGYLKLFMGTAREAASADASSYIDYVEDSAGMYTYTVPVEALDKALDCAAFSKRKEQWYDRLILFDASSLPEDALLLELPDYDQIEAAMAAWENTEISDAAPETEKPIEPKEMAQTETDTQASFPSEPIDADLEDGEYSIEVSLTGGSGKATIVSPTVLTVENGKAYAKIQWSSSNYDYMIVGAEKYLNTSAEGAYSVFHIPVTVMDASMPVIADTTAMGTPHEVAYTLNFYSDSIGPKSQLPQEAAKRVVAIAFVIIIGGGILNHFVNKKRRI